MDPLRRSEETKDKKVQVEIINKETGKTVETETLFFDQAERWCKNKTWGRPYLKYKIFEVMAE